MRQLILALLILTSPPGVSLEQQAPIEFAYLTNADAARLAGRWVRMRIDLDSLPEARDGFVAFDCESADSTQRTVWFEPGEIGGDDGPDVEPTGDGGKFEVFGRLTVVEHSARRFGATYFPGFTELRLMDARRSDAPRSM